jgi:hypothetical protein
MGLMKKLKDGFDEVVKETKDSVSDLKKDLEKITSDAGTGTPPPQPPTAEAVTASPQTTTDSRPSDYSPWLYHNTDAPHHAANNLREEYHPLYHTQVCDCVMSYENAGLNENGQLVLDDWDKALRRTAKATHIGLTVKKTFGTDTVFSSDTDLGVFVTDSRVIFYSPTYKNKGDTYVGWGIGGIIASAVMTAGSAVTAEMSNNQGMVALGHMRYEWITGIGYICHPKRGGFLDEEMQQLQLDYTDSKNRYYSVYINLVNGENARDIANDMLHRICSYRLAMSDFKDPKAVEFWTYYARPISVIPPSSNEQQFSILKLPQGYTAPNGEDVSPCG